jgi:GNAT superfamily N-acetyltransferase
MGEAGPVSVAIRRATEADVPRIVELVHLGTAPGRTSVEDPGPASMPAYLAAFREIAASGFAGIHVAEADGEVVGTFSLCFIPNISNRGGRVAQIESVHVAEKVRGRGVGEQMLRWAIAESRRRGCVRLQLTSNKSRIDAHRFYERLGFEKSHEGMKLAL